MSLSNKLLYIKVVNALEGCKIPSERAILSSKANFHIQLYCKVARNEVQSFFHSSHLAT